MHHKLRTYAEAFLLSFSGLLVALALGWLLLSSVNYSYPIWHDHARIGWAIDKYGGINQYKTGFDLTTRAQRIELFAGISHAINHGGDGLDSLQYSVPGHPTQKLLREAEIVHLQDVANLVTVGKYVGIGAVIVWIGIWIYFFLGQRIVPSLKRQMLVMTVFVGAAGLFVVIVGAKDVFYKLHEWVFPDNHEWFFYYQDSLMSTMMYAPNLFAWIAVEWVILAMLLLAVLQKGAGALVEKLHRRRHL